MRLMYSKPLIISVIMIFLYLMVAESQSDDFVQVIKPIYSAKTIMEQIKNGRDFSCNNGIIIGDIKLNNLNLSFNNNTHRIVNSSLNIANSDIVDNIDLGNAFFQKSLSFDGTTFSGEHVNFRNSQFAGDLGISGAKFKCQADFTGAQINGNITFTKTIWSEEAFFEKVICEGYASFRDNEFQKELIFKDAQINGQADFKNSRFNEYSSFRNSVFGDNVSFLAASFADLIELNGAKLNKSAIFARSRFNEVADFSHTQFANDTTFYYAGFANSAKFFKARFDGITDFRKCGFDGFADFSSASFFGDARFDEGQFNKAARFKDSSFKENASFYEAYFDRDVYLEGARFTSKLNLTNSTFSKLALPWEAISGNIVYDKATQLSLINNYKNLGWTQDYKSSYYDYREKKRISEPIGIPKILDTISWIYWGYGTKPYNPLAYIFAFALIFACIYYGLVHFKNAKVARKTGQPGCEICPWAKKEDGLEEANCKLSFKEALIFSSRILLLMEKPDNFEIEYAHISKIIWIERAVFGFLVVPYIDSLLSELQSYFKPP